MRQNNILRTLAEPTLVTVNGRRVTFHSGGEIIRPHGPDNASASNETTKLGTLIEANPVLQKDGSLKLEFLLTLCDLEPGLDRVEAGQKIPGFRTRQVNSAVALRSGLTMVMSGLHQQRVEAYRRPDGKNHEQVNEIETIILVRPTYEVSSEGS